MNIKITKDEFEYFKENTIAAFETVIGSRMYGTSNEKSDTDILIVHEEFFEADRYYPNYHQLQYDDIKNNIQYILTTDRKFYLNLFSGDSTINADVVLFYLDETDEEKLNMLRTFNIIKAFIGFAKRDIKFINKGKNKLFHIERGLYCAEELLNNRLPNIEMFKNFGNCDIELLMQKEKTLRTQCNNMFDNGELTMFPKLPIIDPVNSLESKIIEANNITKFKY